MGNHKRYLSLIKINIFFFFYTIFEKEIEFEFTKNSLLFIKNNMYYKYDDLSNDYHRLQLTIKNYGV